MAETTRIDVSIENKQAPEPEAKKHPNTCPQCGSHYRDDELSANLRVCMHCGHHFPVKAHERIAQIADEGSFSEEAADLRSADPLKFFDLRAYNERLAVVWIDAHGDLNTPETSPSGNAWGMPLRMVLDDGAVLPRHVALIGARNLDPPEVDFIAASGIQTGEGAIERALEGADAVYVAFDADSVEPGELAVFMPEPDGLRLTEIETLLAEVAARKRIAGLGFTGLLRDAANEPKLARLATALGL